MEVKFGLISADSHAGFDRHDFLRRMSAAKWGERIPCVVEVEDKGRRIDRWAVYGVPRRNDVANCPALMDEPFPTYPKRWDDVPKAYHDPAERLKALDLDRVDAEVLFPNPPGGTFYEFGDRDFELDVVRAYNDALSEWSRVSDRYWPLAILPYLSEPEVITREIERAAKSGHRGINLLGEMPEGLPHITDPHWDPLWATCQEIGLPIHFHGSAGLSAGASVRKWSGYSHRQAHSAQTATSAVTPAQIIPQFIFSGVTERFPALRCVFPEAGVGGLNYIIAACDHEWDCRHLWTEGISTRPSETVRRQMYVNFWFEAEGIKLRRDIGIDNIMWESDFPHVASYYPHSWREVDRVLIGVPEGDRRRMLYENALRVYGVAANASKEIGKSQSCN
jgi:predicted TIM-barrel fold metal-dependent hydrolase